MPEVDLLRVASQSSGAGVWVLVLVALVTLIKGWPALRKLSLEADGSLRKDLLLRIGTLENELAAERRSCDDRLREQDSRHGREMARLEGEVNGLRRQMVQLQQSSGGAIQIGESKEHRP